VRIAVAVLGALACEHSSVGVGPDFSIEVAPTGESLAAGGERTFEVTIIRSEFHGQVDLSLHGAPTGVVGTFDPASTMGNTSTLAIRTDENTPPGSYGLVVHGTATAGDREEPISLTLVPPRPSFALALTTPTLSIGLGAAGQSGVLISRVNFTGEVRLSVSGAPDGVTWTFAPDSSDGSRSTLTVAVAATTAPGEYYLQVLGVSAIGNAATLLRLIVFASSPSFTVTLSRARLSLRSGSSGSLGVAITRAPDFNEAVTLSVHGAPSGLTWAFDPAAPTGNGATLVLRDYNALRTGFFTLTIVGTSSAGSSSATLVVLLGRFPPSLRGVGPSEGPVGSSSAPLVVRQRGRITP